MATIQISKIQLRRGESGDLPGAPMIANDPTTLTAGLDTGELGFTVDTGRLFVGQNSPTGGQANYNRTVYPYRNVEVLTENSPLSSILRPTMSDNRRGFIKSTPMANTPLAATLQVADSSGVPQNFYLDLPGQGACAMMSYFIFDNSGHPIRLGYIRAIWYAAMTHEPLFDDVSSMVLGDIANITWSVAVTPDLHLVLQYVNITGGPVTTWFRIERPAIL